MQPTRMQTAVIRAMLNEEVQKQSGRSDFYTRAAELTGLSRADAKRLTHEIIYGLNALDTSARGPYGDADT